jgi:eukaryotic-like serine/threonine-protein kinase
VGDPDAVSEPRVLADRYELRSLIATGGMGQVWRAHDRRLSRPVAVKVLRSEYAGDPEFLARFRAEARHAALLGHRNVTAVFDYGETLPGPGAAGGEHLAWLVMELVPGESLAAVRRRVGALPAEQVLEVVAQAGAGLGAAHEAGIVHRDVKPGNLLLRPEGSVAVTDFGIAWSAESVALTRTGQVIGTAHYLSPEQARGRPATPASDVYALGMVAYELLAGRRAFEGESSVAVALQQLHDEPDPLPASVPAPVRELVAAMLVKDAAHRLADGDAVVAAADRARRALGEDEPTELLTLVPPPAVTALLSPALDTGTATTAAPAVAPARRRRMLVAAVVAALLLVGGGTALLVGLGGSSPAEAGSTPTSASPTPDAIPLDAADYTGRPVDEVVAELTALGLSVTTEQVAGDGSADGLVTGVDPTGELQPGAAVTVSYGSPAPATTEPTTQAPTTQATTQAPVTTQAPAPTQAPVTEEPAPAPTTQAGPGAGGAGNGGPGNGNGNGNGGGPGGGGPGNGGGPGADGPGRGNGKP